MSDIETKIAHIESMRTMIGAAAADAAIAALRAESTGPSSSSTSSDVTQSTRNQNIGGNAQIGVVVGNDVHGNIYLYGQRGKTATELIRGYLERVAKRCGSLPLQGVREQKAADDVLAISLEQVYTQLAVTILTDREMLTIEQLQSFSSKDYWKQHIGEKLLPYIKREALFIPKGNTTDIHSVKGYKGKHNEGEVYDLQHLTVDEFEKLRTKIIERNVEHSIAVSFGGTRLVTEAITISQRLVLLGEPGSGKSTALRYLALTLAEAGLNEQVDLAQRLEGWGGLGKQGRLLPIFLPLLPLAKRLVNEPGKAGSDEDLWNEIAQHLEPKGAYPGLAAAVRDELEAGRVLLMLDGLDEVAGAESRRRVVCAVRNFAEQHPNCRIVVACRVRAYEGEQNAEWQLSGWPTSTLADWTLGQMNYFIEAWYHAAAAANAMTVAKRDERIAALKRALDVRKDLKKLGVRPLLLTIMALVHLNYGSLPEDRVSLYSRCIEILLSQWETRGKDATEYGALMDYIKLPETDVKALRPLLTRAAFVAHQASDGENLGRIDRSSLRTIVADGLETLKHPNPHEGAKRFLEYTDVRAGLLQASDAGDAYVFPHQTFQEYLAGLELVGDVDFVRKVMEKRADDRWRVPIFLGVGHTVSESVFASSYQLLNRLLHAKDRAEDRRQRDLVLAAELAADIGWERLERGGEEFTELKHDLAEHLAQVVEGTALPADERIHAGVLLGELGDLRLGVCMLPPAMATIQGGTFAIGQLRNVENDNKWNQQLLSIATFELARYPVTNAQYELFIADNGYELSKLWWKGLDKPWFARNNQSALSGENWQQHQSKDVPEFWEHERYGRMRPNHPIVGVSWYEATVFCRWLTHHLEDGWVYRLPSEAEWEYAARGIGYRTYPWGDPAPDAERTNHQGLNDGTTAVGCFALGATPENIRDLAGNVYEWTASVYGRYELQLATVWEVPEDLGKKVFANRGGGWRDRSFDLQASKRNTRSRSDRNNDLGFRIARHLTKK